MKAILSFVGVASLIIACFALHPFFGVFALCSVLLYVMS